METNLNREPRSAKGPLSVPPYRSRGKGPSPADEEYDREQLNADIAFTFAFIWATALLRFVIVCRRHEPFTADPIFAAILTFGIPAVVLLGAIVALFRAARGALRSLSPAART